MKELLSFFIIWHVALVAGFLLYFLCKKILRPSFINYIEKNSKKIQITLIPLLTAGIFYPTIKHHWFDSPLDPLWPLRYVTPAFIFICGFLFIPSIKKEIKDVENTTIQKQLKRYIFGILLPIALITIASLVIKNYRPNSRADSFNELSFFLMKHRKKTNDTIQDYCWQPDTCYGYFKDGTPESKTIFIYDLQQQLTQCIISKFKNGNWIEDKQYSYFYNSNGNKIMAQKQLWDDSIWVYCYKENFIYDTNNNQVSYLFQEWKNGKWQNNSMTDYFYNKDNLQQKAIIKKWEEGKWQDDYRKNYSYDPKQNLILKEFYFMNDGKWDEPYKDFYTYDNNNHLQTTTSYNSYSHNRQPQEKNIIYYDEKGNSVKQLFLLGKRKELINTAQYICTYDTINHTESYIFQVWEKERFENFVKEDFFYDENGNEIKGEFWKWDKKNGIWVPSEEHSHRIYYNNSKDYLDMDNCHKVIISYSTKKKCK